MNPPGEAIAVAVALVAAMAAYALFAGADLGAGIWDALAGGTRRGGAPRAAIRESAGPVYEANNVWIIFGLVILWTAFPAAFAAVMTALFVPLAAALLGIVLRGLGFAFRQETDRLPLKALTTTLFAGSSVVAPFFLGTAVGAVATGRVRPGVTGDLTAAWTSPASLVTGCLFTATCAYIGAVYLVDDCRRRGHEPLSRYFRRRAIAAGILTGVLAAVNLTLLHGEAPYVSGRLLHTAWPLVVVSVAAGALALFMIAAARTRIVRPVAAAAVAGVVAAWGWAQYPYLLPRSLTLAGGSAPPTALSAQLVIVGLAAVLVGPMFAYLYWLQQHGRLREDSASAVRLRAPAADRSPQPEPAATRTSRLVTAVVAGVAAAGLARSALTGLRRRKTHVP